MKFFINPQSSSVVRVGDDSLVRNSVAAGSSPLILDKWPDELETLTTRA